MAIFGLLWTKNKQPLQKFCCGGQFFFGVQFVFICLIIMFDLTGLTSCSDVRFTRYDYKNEILHTNASTVMVGS
jgi:hypothetical protein